MYFGNIAESDVKSFHQQIKVNTIMTTTDLRQYSKVDNISSTIKRVKPLFYADTVTSDNTNDNVLSNRCIITNGSGSKYTLGNGTTLFNRDYIEPYDIDDTLTTAEFNKIIYLLKRYAIVKEDAIVSETEYKGEYGDIEYTISNAIFTDKGLLKLGNSFSVTAKLKNPQYTSVQYKLRCKYIDNDSLNIDGDIEEFDTVEYDVNLTSGTAVSIVNSGMANNDTILYDAELIVDFNAPEIRSVE